MTFRFAPTAAIVACAAMATSPLAAAEMPQQSRPVAIAATGAFDADAVNVHQYYDPYGRYRRNRTSVGDVIGTVVAIGAIAAVASAVSKASSRDRTRGYPYPDPSDDQRKDYRSRNYDDGGRGIDRAVDMCAQETERNARIETVDTVNRNGTGWTVGGRLRTGAPFTCSIGADGRIDTVDYGQQGYGQQGAMQDNQWADDRYAAARAAQASAGLPPPSVEPQMAGDTGYETADAPEVSD